MLGKTPLSVEALPQGMQVVVVSRAGWVRRVDLSAALRVGRRRAHRRAPASGHQHDTLQLDLPVSLRISPTNSGGILQVPAPGGSGHGGNLLWKARRRTSTVEPVEEGITWFHPEARGLALAYARRRARDPSSRRDPPSVTACALRPASAVEGPGKARLASVREGVIANTVVARRRAPLGGMVQPYDRGKRTSCGSARPSRCPGARPAG